MYKIYSLIDPNTNEVRYIGATTLDLGSRLSQHIYDNGKNNLKRDWINSLLNQRKKPIINLIEETESWQEREIFWINQYSNLLNVKEGGTGIVLNRSTESIKASSEAHEIPVIQLSIDNKVINTYNSIKKASEATGALRTAIGNVLRKRSVTAGGYHWVYEDEYTPEYKVLIRNKAAFSEKKFIKKSVIAKLVDNTEISFNSLKDCAIHFGVSQCMISMVLLGKRKIKNVTLRYSLI